MYHRFRLLNCQPDRGGSSTFSTQTLHHALEMSVCENEHNSGFWLGIYLATEYVDRGGDRNTQWKIQVQLNCLPR
jgi:hypothetical protein